MMGEKQTKHLQFGNYLQKSILCHQMKNCTKILLIKVDRQRFNIIKKEKKMIKKKLKSKKLLVVFSKVFIDICIYTHAQRNYDNKSISDATIKV